MARLPRTTKPSSKRQSLHDSLAGLIAEMRPGAQLPSYTQMCQQFGVCQSTINYVLDDLEKAGQIERRPWRGIFIAEGAKRRRIGVVFTRDVFGPEYSPVYGQFMEEARRRAGAGREEARFYINVHSAPGSPLPKHHDLVADLEAGQLHGLILIGLHSPEMLDFVEEHAVPYAIFEPQFSLPNSVRIDYGAIVAQGVGRLAAEGCRRIGLVNTQKYRHVTTPGFADYAALFRAKAAEHGVEVDEDWIVENVRAPRIEPEAPFPVAKEVAYRLLHDHAAGLLAKGRERERLFPDGLVVTDDMNTCGIAVALERDFGLRVGRDIRIATHANRGSSALFGYEQNLELLEIDPARIVDALFGIVERRIESEAEGREEIIVPPAVVPSRAAPVPA